jgi:hypothetical protein
MSTTQSQEIDLDEAISLKDLLNTHFPIPQWVISGFFETGSVNMISAAPNQYKSWVVHHMAICVASGKPVFDQIAVTKQNVMIVNEEDTPRQMKDRSKMLYKEDQDLPVYFHISKGIKIDDTFVGKLLEEMKLKNITFLILDSLRSLHDAEENSSKEMQEVLDRLKRFTRSNITVLFTHHHRKRNRNYGPESDPLGGEESRGSSSINAAINGHITCEPKNEGEEKILIISQHKLKSDLKFNPIKVLIELNSENNEMRFVYDGDYNSKVESQKKLELNLLPEFVFGVWLSVKDLLSREIASERLIREALRQLVKKNILLSKTRKELLDMNYPVDLEGKSTEVFYSLPNAKEYEDPGY